MFILVMSYGYMNKMMVIINFLWRFEMLDYMDDEVE